MISEKFKFSTNMKISQIVEKLEKLSTGKTLLGKRKITDNYFGNYDIFGFTFQKSGGRPLGTYIFSSKFRENKTKTEVQVSVKPSLGTLAMYFIIMAIMIIGVLSSNSNYNILGTLTFFVLLALPILFIYFSLKIDVKKAKEFLMDTFQITESSFIN